jgi:hypothetical protein
VKLLLSGEGKTDMGQNAPTETGWQFQPGPMAWMVDRLLEFRLGYSLLETFPDGDTVKLVDEAELAQYAKSGPMKLPGLKYGKETGLFTRNAQALGLLAKEDRKASNQPVIAVLFRDADSTRSSSRQDWQNKFDSMLRGFAIAEFDAGVPMLPRPKSEAWLLCGLKQSANAECDSLEEAPGNDNSPKSLKKQLADLLGHEPSRAEQSEWIQHGDIDLESISMPSFAEFRKALKLAIDKVVPGAPT